MRKILDLSLVFCLTLGLTCASVRADDPKDKAALPAQVKKPGVIVKAPDSFTLYVALTADGKLFARAGADETVDLWDVASGKKLHTLTGHTARIFKVAFSPDGKTLASITGNFDNLPDPLPDEVRGEVKLWDVATGKERVSLKGHPDRGFALAFSAEGNTLASGSEGKVKLWDVATGKEKMELGVGVWSLAFSPDGKTLALGVGGLFAEEVDKPGSVQLWDLTTGKKRASMPGHQNGDLCVGFTPDGKTLVSMSRTSDKAGSLKLWDVATAKERATIAIPGLSPLQYASLAFTVDGNTLISATWSLHEEEKEGGFKKGGLSVQHWELATGKARATFWAPFNAGEEFADFYFAALSADGKTVAWGGAEKQGEKISGTAHVWDVQSLDTSPPKLPKEWQEPPAKKTPPEQDNDAEAKAAEAIKKLGGTITRDEQAAGKPVIGVSFEHTGITNEGLKELKAFKHLQSLNLNRCYRVTDAALKEIAELKSLRILDLGFTGLQTETAGNAGYLGESILVSLVFRMGLGIPRRDCTGITNQGLAQLKQLENLQSLDLDSTQITDAGLAELKTLKNLQTLVIGYNKITGTGLAELKDLKNLQHLDLIHSGVTDEGAKCLAELQSLKTIDLRGTQITDAGLKELQSLYNLKELNLCLVPGGPFDVTREGIKELRTALPEANILR